jgi:1-acyl-sn-glycerol-3-phosphate acyltransferase
VQYQVSRMIAGPLLKTYVRPAVTGLEHVPATGGAIMASNHLSIIDSIYLPLMVPRPVTFAAKSEYFTGTRLIDRATAAYLRATNQLAVDRTGPRATQETLDVALKTFLDGQLFGIYPEGTRSPDGRLYRGRIGVGWLAVNSGLPVIPVAMTGTDRVLAPGRIIPHPGRIQIIFGKPLTFGPEVLSGPPAKARRAVTDEVMRAIQALSGQEYVPVYASTRKEELAAAKSATPTG